MVLFSFVIILSMVALEGAREHIISSHLNQVTQVDRVQVAYGVCVSYKPRQVTLPRKVRGNM